MVGKFLDDTLIEKGYIPQKYIDTLTTFYTKEYKSKVMMRSIRSNKGLILKETYYCEQDSLVLTFTYYKMDMIRELIFRFSNDSLILQYNEDDRILSKP